MLYQNPQPLSPSLCLCSSHHLPLTASLNLSQSCMCPAPPSTSTLYSALPLHLPLHIPFHDTPPPQPSSAIDIPSLPPILVSVCHALHNSSHPLSIIPSYTATQHASLSFPLHAPHHPFTLPHSRHHPLQDTHFTVYPPGLYPSASHLSTASQPRNTSPPHISISFSLPPLHNSPT